MLPYAHAKSISNCSVHVVTDTPHRSYLEIVNPSPDKLIEFLYFIAVANAPTTAS